MVVAYLRVSTNKQHLMNQKEEIRKFAQKRQLTIDEWYYDIVSGKINSNDRQLGNLLEILQEGDCLIVTEVSRLSRTLIDIMNIINTCIQRKMILHCTKEGYTFDDTINSKVLCFAFGLVAEIERNLISMRTKEALALRKAEGVVLGRRKGSITKTKILIENKEAVMDLLCSGKNIGEVCRIFNVSRDTFRKFRKLYPEIESCIAH